MIPLPLSYYQLLTVSISELLFSINFRLETFPQLCRIFTRDVQLYDVIASPLSIAGLRYSPASVLSSLDGTINNA